MICDTLIRNANVLDGTGSESQFVDLAIHNGRIAMIGSSLDCSAQNIVEAEGLSLAPGFIDVHTHDDTSVIDTPELLPKISQGITTVIVGNCGISASPVRLRGDPPDPLNLLGSRERFRYPTFASLCIRAPSCPSLRQRRSPHRTHIAPEQPSRSPRPNRHSIRNRGHAGRTHLSALPLELSVSAPA